MTKLPAITGERLIKALERSGFSVLRKKGSHVYLLHDDGRATVVPVHKSETLGRGLLKKIMRDTELTREALLKLLAG